MGALLRSHFSMNVLLQICYIFIRTRFHKSTSVGLFTVKTIYSQRCPLFLKWVVIAYKLPHILFVSKSKNVMETRLQQRFFDFWVNLVWKVFSLHSLDRVLFLNIACSILKRKKCLGNGVKNSFYSLQNQLGEQKNSFYYLHVLEFVI